MEANTNIIFDASSQYQENFYLSEEMAAFRFDHITDVSYDACLALPKGDKFFGIVTIKFNLKAVPQKSLPLDFRGLKIARLSINSRLVENSEGNS